eukprot:6480697-Amphidinium_carterae.1
MTLAMRDAKFRPTGQLWPLCCTPPLLTQIWNQVAKKKGKINEGSAISFGRLSPVCLKPSRVYLLHGELFSKEVVRTIKKRNKQAWDALLQAVGLPTKKDLEGYIRIMARPGSLAAEATRQQVQEQPAQQQRASQRASQSTGKRQTTNTTPPPPPPPLVAEKNNRQVKTEPLQEAMPQSRP